MTIFILSLLFACETSQDPATLSAPTAQTAQAASPQTPTPGDDTVVAKWNGGSITLAEIQTPIQGRLTQMEAEYLSNRYQLERGSLDQLVDEKILEEEVKRRNLSAIQELLKVEIEDKVEAPTELELRAFFESVKGQLRGSSFEQVKPRLIQAAANQKQQERFVIFTDELKSKAGIELFLPFPAIPRMVVSVDDDPSIGPDDAPITIIQFAEYQCPYCGKAGESVDQVMAEYPGKIKMVYRDFPLSFHDRAIPAAVAANCSGEQGKYWEMHKLLMANQRALTEEDLINHAKSLSLDFEKWSICRKDPSQALEVQKDFEDGSAVGVSGTPAFFINGIMLSGAVPFEQFKEIIDRELEHG